MLDVAGALRTELRRDILAERLGQHAVDVQQVLAAAVRDVERLAGRLVGSEAGLQVGLHHVRHVGEVAALPAVAMDDRLLAVEQHPDELRNHRRIRALGILTLPEDVEVAQADGSQPVMTAVLLRPLLVATLGHGVRTQQIALDALALGQFRPVAIHRARRGIHERLDAALAGGLQHVQRALDVVERVEKRHLETARHTPPRRLVHHVVHPLARRETGVQVLHIAAHELVARVVREEIDIRLFAGTEVIEAAHPAAQVQHRLAQVRPDEARPARH